MLPFYLFRLVIKLINYIMYVFDRLKQLIIVSMIMTKMMLQSGTGG